MAHPFLPMTNEILEKLTRINKNAISTPKFYEQRFVFSIPNTRPIEELNLQISETNLSNLRTNNRY
jgi:hypothetical protein